jgi:hypothetical protein
MWPNWQLNDWSWHRFWYGVIGAAAPEVVRIIKLGVGGDIALSPFLVLVSAVFLFLGGALASAWKEEDPIKCIYMGATFPLWFSAWAHMGSIVTK